MTFSDKITRIFHKGTSVYVFFGRRDERDFTGQFENISGRDIRDRDNKKVCPAGL